MNKIRPRKSVLISLIFLVYQPFNYAQSLARSGKFHIIQEQSTVTISVYRAGALSVFGHNHVISSHALSGKIDLVNGNTDSGHFSMTMPLQSLQVDNESERKRMGKAFRTSVSESAKAGTRKHMLGSKVLDYPNFKNVKVDGDLVGHTVSAAITLHGITQSVRVPVSISHSGNQLLASGKFSIKQSSFGIQPYQAAAGLLKIKDTITIEFSIAAEK